MPVTLKIFEYDHMFFGVLLNAPPCGRVYAAILDIYDVMFTDKPLYVEMLFSGSSRSTAVVVNQSNISEVLHPIPLEFPATYTTYKARSDNSVEITYDVTTKPRFVEYLVNLLKTSETRDVFELKDPR